ncbi:unnamed protein product [Staurois parvus]|uniref:Phosphatase and actin regulator n=1 Tax=Staurois parvus TaxID=386267 RepID=A0ABN9CI67_9NEOB|nr:unnamed protein product [Staurois parvus]
MAQSPALRTEYLVSGMRTPPARRNSKLATLGRIFKPWKWRKKKSDKLKHSPAGLEKKSSTKQNRDEVIRKGLIEIVDIDPDSKESPSEDTTTEDFSDYPSPTSQAPSPEETLQEILSAANINSLDEDQHEEEEASKMQMTLEEELKDSVEKTLQALLLTESLESPPPERKTQHSSAALRYFH